MKKLLILSLILFSSSIIYTQNLFKEGYFITNEDEKVDCLILDQGWVSNPKSIYYKISKETQTKFLKIDDISFFEVTGSVRFLRKTILMDKTSTEVRNLSGDSNSKWEEETIFLRELIAGPANLYYYGSSFLERFFVSTDSIELFQLEYKPYLSSSASKVLYNKNYIKQLQDLFPCNEIPFDRYLDLKYKEKDMISYFHDYNKCKDSDYKKPVSSEKTKVRLSLKAGLNFSKISLRAEGSFLFTRSLTDYGLSLDPRIGFEAEIIPPRMNNRFSVFFEPNVNFRNKKSDILESTYYYLSLTQGARFYQYFGSTHGLFVEGVLLYDFPLALKISGVSNINIVKGLSGGLGLGYNFNKKFSVQYRIIGPRDLFHINVEGLLAYNNSSVILGYSF